MSDIYVDLPPPEAQRIEALHAWIATYANGAEGIVSADMPMPAGVGIRHVPLLSGNRRVAESMRPLAERAWMGNLSRSASSDPATFVVGVRLATFALSEGG